MRKMLATVLLLALGLVAAASAEYLLRCTHCNKWEYVTVTYWCDDCEDWFYEHPGHTLDEEGKPPPMEWDCPKGHWNKAPTQAACSNPDCLCIFWP